MAVVDTIMSGMLVGIYFRRRGVLHCYAMPIPIPALLAISTRIAFYLYLCSSYTFSPFVSSQAALYRLYLAIGLWGHNLP